MVVCLGASAARGASAFQLKSDYDIRPASASYAKRSGGVSVCRKRRQAGAARIGFAGALPPSNTNIDSAAIRFGLTATKKIGNAVIRNRTRRRLRVLAHESLSAHGQPGYDYVLIGRAATKHRTWDGLRTDLRSALKKVHKAEN